MRIKINYHKMTYYYYKLNNCFCFFAGFDATFHLILKSATMATLQNDIHNYQKSIIHKF